MRLAAQVFFQSLDAVFEFTEFRLLDPQNASNAVLLSFFSIQGLSRTGSEAILFPCATDSMASRKIE